MNTSGDAAEQVVRLGLESAEVAAKVTGSAAKEVAALLLAALKNRDKSKIKGRQRLTSMLRSGKELNIFTVKNQDMARFVADAKRYGVVYCVLREAKDNPHGVSEIMVRAEDAAKINRIVEHLQIATVSAPEQEAAPENPTAARTEKSRPSAPSSERKRTSAAGTAKGDLPSVREALKEIRREQQEAEPRQPADRSKNTRQQTEHRQTPPKKRGKKRKER